MSYTVKNEYDSFPAETLGGARHLLGKLIPNSNTEEGIFKIYDTSTMVLITEDERVTEVAVEPNTLRVEILEIKASLVLAKEAAASATTLGEIKAAFSLL